MEFFSWSSKPSWHPHTVCQMLDGHNLRTGFIAFIKISKGYVTFPHSVHTHETNKKDQEKMNNHAEIIFNYFFHTSLKWWTTGLHQEIKKSHPFYGMVFYSILENLSGSLFYQNVLFRNSWAVHDLEIACLMKFLNLPLGLANRFCAKFVGTVRNYTRL